MTLICVSKKQDLGKNSKKSVLSIQAHNYQSSTQIPTEKKKVTKLKAYITPAD